MLRETTVTQSSVVSCICQQEFKDYSKNNYLSAKIMSFVSHTLLTVILFEVSTVALSHSVRCWHWCRTSARWWHVMCHLLGKQSPFYELYYVGDVSLCRYCRSLNFGT